MKSWRVEERGGRTRAEGRARLKELGVEALVIGVPTIAKLIGSAPSTLYGHIKRKTFFLPVRELHGSPVVMVDDLLDWMCRPVGSAQPEDPKVWAPTEVANELTPWQRSQIVDRARRAANPGKEKGPV